MVACGQVVGISAPALPQGTEAVLLIERRRMTATGRVRGGASSAGEPRLSSQTRANVPEGTEHPRVEH